MGGAAVYYYAMRLLNFTSSHPMSTPLVTIKTLPPRAPAGRRWQLLDTAPGGVEVALPQLKPRFLNWRQAKALHLGLVSVLTRAVANRAEDAA